MAIFNSYVSLTEGNIYSYLGMGQNPGTPSEPQNSW